MHKGYAFVQFTNPFDARNACHGEDGRTILSQVLGKYSCMMSSITCNYKSNQCGRVSQMCLCEWTYQTNQLNGLQHKAHDFRGAVFWVN